MWFGSYHGLAMRLYVSHLLFLVAGLTLGLLLASSWQLLDSCTSRYEEYERIVRRGLQDCVCEDELFSLQRLAELCSDDKSTGNVSAAEFAAGGGGKSDDVAAMNTYLHPADSLSYKERLRLKTKNRLGYKPGTKDEPMLLSEEYTFKEEIFVGVLTQEAYLSTRAQSVYETWGKQVDKLVFFVGEDCNISAELSHLPIVKLKGVPDVSYPPLKKSFAVLSYIYKHYVSQFKWFIRADDDVYIRTNKLRDLLRKMNPYESVYLGRAGIGRKEHLQGLKLLLHERYCMGGPGIILSAGVLRLIAAHLESCVEAVAVLFQGEEDRDLIWDDVEIGRCFSRKLDVQCSSSTESRLYFVFDYHGDALRPLTLWTKPDFKDLISLHPLKQRNNMRAVHHYYTTLEFESKFEELQVLVKYLNDLCVTLPAAVAPPRSIHTGCNITLDPHFGDFIHLLNYLGTSPFIVPIAEVPFVHNPRDRFDLLPWIRFNNSLVQEIGGFSPQHAPCTSFRSEMTHILRELALYLSKSKSQQAFVGVKILDGYTRFNPHLGREYLLNLNITFEGEKTSELKQFHLIREFGPSISLIETPLSILTPPTVHVILPVEHINDRLRGFLSNYVSINTAPHSGQQNRLHLIAVMFSNELASDLKLELNDIIQTSLVSLSITMAIGEGSFNRIKAIDIGMMSLTDKQAIVFVANINVRFGDSFFSHCHSNTIRQERVYFPIPFELHGSYNRWSRWTTSDPPPLTSVSGQWLYYNNDLVCIYKEDYDSINDLHDNKYGEGLFERVSASFLEVIQAPDPSLFLLGSDKSCRDLESISQRELCQRLKQVGQEDQVERSKYLGELNSLRNTLLFTAGYSDDEDSS